MSISGHVGRPSNVWKFIGWYTCIKFRIFRRGVNDIIHKVTAVGSRSIESAQAFIDANAAGDKSIKAYGSYADVYADPASVVL